MDLFFSDEELEMETGIVEFFYSKNPNVRYKWRKLAINKEELAIWSDWKLSQSNLKTLNLMTEDFSLSS